MPRSTITFETVEQMGLSLPGVEKSLAYGAPALKIRGELLACIPVNRSAEPDSLLVRVDFDDRAELLRGDPVAYYLPEHYVNYAGVLVRLSRVDRGTLRDLLGMAHKFVTRQPKPASRKMKRRSTRLG